MNNKLKILAIGAHPDDIEIYMYGLLRKFKCLGNNVYNIIATDGSKGGEKKGDRLKHIRKKETIKGLQDFGKPFFLNITDSTFGDSLDHKIILKKQINEIDPDLIITHSKNDYHQDHQNLSSLMKSIATFNYPVLNADTFMGINFLPNYYVDITDEFEKKIEAIMKHESQNPQNYVNAVKIWNGFRSAQCNGKLGTYAEAYSFDPSFPFSDIRSFLPNSPTLKPTSLRSKGGLI